MEHDSDAKELTNEVPEENKNKNPVSREVAESDFERFLDAMDIQVNPDKLDDEELDKFDDQKEKIVVSIERGHGVVNDDGIFEYTPHRIPDSETIIFYEGSGESLLASDGKKKNDDFRKLFAIMAKNCKIRPKVFYDMKSSDINVCVAVITLLMG